MNDAQRKQLLNLKLAEMAEKGISARTLYADGMGVADNSSENLLYPVRSALALGDGVPDAVVVLSDFDVAPDTPYWATTDKSYAELRRHFLQNNTRLFLVTVAYLPSVAMPKLMAVAEQSGGREIVFKFLEDQTASCT